MNLEATSIIHNFKNLKHNTLIIDTETTGLGYDDEIVEISIIDAFGNVIFDSLIKPTKTIPAEAMNIHGITNSIVEDAPSFAEAISLIKNICDQQNVVFYNKKYDKRLIDQTCKLHGYQNTDTWNCRFLCAMESYADFKKTPCPKGYGYKWHSLSNAAQQLGIEVPKNLHRALADAKLTLEVIRTAHQTLEDQHALKQSQVELGETA